MSDREETAAIGALKNRFPVSAPCGKLGIPRSSHCYAKAASCAPGRHARDRRRIRSVFEGSREAFGPERIWMALERGDDGGEPGCTSEKAARRIMREEGLVVVHNKRRRRCSPCKGEIGAHPGGKVARSFRADAPNRPRLADIAQLILPSFKCYLSVIADRWEGGVARTVEKPERRARRPALVEAVRRLEGDDRPVLHSDCGRRCRRPGRIGICSEYGIARSMSKKACPPGDAACEGFFGRLRNKLFYHRSWDGMAFENFSRMLNGYITCCNTRRRKKSLGWKSPEEHRLFLGYAT